jgi:nitrite reductase/ring-hydroxylating ferredoxin subunit
MKILIGSQQDLTAHKRHVLTFRRAEDYLCVVLFHFENLDGSIQWHSLINECPHLGASMEDAMVEEFAHLDAEDALVDVEESSRMIVCPWHNYDFDLATGESSSGLSICTYPISVTEGLVYVELEEGYQLISCRPVSQTFPATSVSTNLSIENLSLEEEPKTLTDWARLILLTAHPAQKVEYTRRAASLFRKGKLKQIGSAIPPDEPPRDSSLSFVDPGKANRRGKGGSAKSRISLLHSLANIEQWAIDLAWDIICRFPSALYCFLSVRAKILTGYEGKKLPLSFFSDFVQVAEDEAKHHTLLVSRLEALGSYYGALPIHNSSSNWCVGFV